ncbi:MAG: hypothetical protein FXV79_04820, partial [Candidatus Thioglobus sp.]
MPLLLKLKKAAMNPCRCGHADDPELACHRLPLCRQDYLGRIS